VRVYAGKRYYLLVRHVAGHWGFPKGHPEEGESYLDTALRELAEETGIARVSVNADRPFEEQYLFTKRSGKRVHKKVVYFVGEVSAGQSVRLQASEVSDYAWGDAAQTRARMSFDEGRALLDTVVGYLANGA